MWIVPLGVADDYFFRLGVSLLFRCGISKTTNKPTRADVQVSIRTEEEISTEGVSLVKNTSCIRDPIAVGVFENEDTISFWSSVIFCSFVSVVFLHKDTAIRRNCNSDRGHDLWVLRE